MPLSYSQLASYKSCPRKYEFAFIKKLKTPLTPEGAFGVSMHSCLAKWGKREVDSGKRIVDSDQARLFAEDVPRQSTDLRFDFLLSLWQESFVTNGYESKVAADFDRKRGEILLAKFFEWWKKEERKVIAVEKGFKLTMEQWSNGTIRKYENTIHAKSSTDITGRFDRIEEKPDGTLRIIDFKTGGLRSQESVDQDVQLSVYALAARETFKKEVSELVMLFLVDAELREIITQRSAGELRTASKTITLLSERISSKDYTPTPSIQKCRTCPYRRVCDASASL
jgi:DNA helicase II / ATP-dependent DNA helicase PcrA